jgi:hypothetical protein
MGHEERFPPTRLSVGCGFSKEAITGTRRNGRDAPIPDLPALDPQGGVSDPEWALIALVALSAARRRTLAAPQREFARSTSLSSP